MPEENLNQFRRLVLQKSELHYTAEDGSNTTIPVARGLMSGLKMTSVIGSLANMIYREILLGPSHQLDVYQGDDAALVRPSLIQTVLDLQEYESEGL